MAQAVKKYLILVIAVIAMVLSGCAILTGQVTSLTITDQKIGTGTEAVPGASLTVDYTGWIFDPKKSDKKGRHFDTTKGAGAFSFLLGKGQVIKGWDIGIKGMKIGGQRTLIIPPKLAYGEHGSGKKIPPGATLVFDVELVDVNGEKSGFVIKEEKIGSGAAAKYNSSVTVEYTGWLYDEKASDYKGKKFDSSIGVEPFTFLLGKGRVIAGWDQGVRGMQVGGKRTLIVPSGMAYGKRGVGKSIPPDAKLIFEVELLKMRH